MNSSVAMTNLADTVLKARLVSTSTAHPGRTERIHPVAHGVQTLPRDGAVEPVRVERAC